MSLDSISPWVPLFIFAARVVDVSIGTLRLIFITRGHRLVAVVLAFFEILVWVCAVTVVLSHLDNWLNVLAFAAGFATGNAVGMAIERKLALGLQRVTFVSRSPHPAVAERLRFADLQVTSFDASGRNGPVAMCVTIVPRKITPMVVQMAKEIDSDVLVTIDEVESTMMQLHLQMPGKSPARPYAIRWRTKRGLLPPTQAA